MLDHTNQNEVNNFGPVVVKEYIVPNTSNNIFGILPHLRESTIRLNGKTMTGLEFLVLMEQKPLSKKRTKEDLMAYVVYQHLNHGYKVIADIDEKDLSVSFGFDKSGKEIRSLAKFQ